MNQLKNDIIDKVLNIEDEGVINALNQLLDNVSSPYNRSISNIEKQILNEGLADYRKGNTISDDQLRAEEDSWLKE